MGAARIRRMAQRQFSRNGSKGHAPRGNIGPNGRRRPARPALAFFMMTASTASPTNSSVNRKNTSANAITTPSWCVSNMS